MRKWFIFLLFVVISTIIGAPAKAANVNDFYFSDFTGDYYLSRDAEGISHLRVVESVTAVFPNYNQNKGICRQISFTNQDGKNVTLPSLTKTNLTLTRNGKPENIYSIEKEGNYYNVCTGTDEYVLGEQTYVFEYEFTKVVTEFNKDGREFQELYWDTNGNGALQKFEKVTARLHFENMDIWSGESWCYVGKYGEGGQDRCTITKTEDGVKFESKDLGRYENMTFDVELKAGSFVVPEPPQNYSYLIVTVVLVVICGVFIIYKLMVFMKNKHKMKYYKGIFVKPEYQPNNDYSLPEMSEIFIGKKKDVKVAMLLELIVKKKIELIKNEKNKSKWAITVKNLEDVNSEYIDLLAILNGGDKPEVNDMIEIKRRTASTKLVDLKKSMDKKILGDLKRDGLAEKKYRYGSSDRTSVASVIVTSIIAIPVIGMIGLMILSTLDKAIDLGDPYDGFFVVAAVIIAVTVVICASLGEVTRKYSGHSLKGLEASRYMDGLKLYIEMAEAERMKMLQSVKGVDVSPSGIVKLYEKLLPYAAVFGLEKSWMNEMKEYCQVTEVAEPDYLLTGIAVAELSRGLSNAASYATTATVMSSSGGGSSSGFSGGGGGGFSGGGGGGGGFSGR